MDEFNPHVSRCGALMTLAEYEADARLWDSDLTDEAYTKERERLVEEIYQRLVNEELMLGKLEADSHNVCPTCDELGDMCTCSEEEKCQ